MLPRSNENFPWYIALSSVAVLAAAIGLGFPIPKAVVPWSMDKFNDGPQLFAYLLLAGLAAFMCAQDRLERRSISGYKSHRAFVLSFMGMFAFLCTFAGSVLYDLLRSSMAYVVRDWPRGGLEDAWERAQIIAAIVRASSPVLLLLMIAAAFFVCGAFFRSEEVPGTVKSARRSRAVGMFTGVVAVVSLLVECGAPSLTPSLFILAYDLSWQPLYGTLSVLLWTVFPTFVIARWVAPHSMPISRPGRIFVFGIATVAVIQVLRIAAVVIGWEPIFVAIRDAGYFPAVADFHEHHPLAAVAIVYVLQLPLALASVWCGARLALKHPPVSDTQEAAAKIQ